MEGFADIIKGPSPLILRNSGYLGGLNLTIWGNWCALATLRMKRGDKWESVQLVSGSKDQNLTGSQKENRDFSPTVIRNWFLPTTWMILEVGASPEPSDRAQPAYIWFGPWKWYLEQNPANPELPTALTVLGQQNCKSCRKNGSCL